MTLREKEAQKQFELLLLQKAKERHQQEDLLRSEKHSKSYNQQAIQGQQLREALDRKQSEYQRKQQNDMIAMNKLTYDAQHERERTMKAKEAKRLRELSVAYENELQIKGKQAQKQNQKDGDLNAH